MHAVSLLTGSIFHKYLLMEGLHFVDTDNDSNFDHSKLCARYLMLMTLERSKMPEFVSF
jgi:hypothetical protein